MNKWQKRVVEHKAKKLLIKLYKKKETEINNIQQEIAKLVETEEEQYEQHVIVMLCTAIIAGFETKQERMQTLEMIKITLEGLE